MLASFSTITGRSIDIESIYCQRTYLGMGAGKPDEETNQDVVAGMIKRVQRLWPGVPVAVVNEIGPDPLPLFCVAAMAHSSQPVSDANMHGSQLVLIWFDHSPPSNPEAFSSHLLKAFAWEKYAADFKW
jgi:hypothetical protein